MNRIARINRHPIFFLWACVVGFCLLLGPRRSVAAPPEYCRFIKTQSSGAGSGDSSQVVSWNYRRIYYQVNLNEKGCNGGACASVPREVALGAIKRAFNTWESPSCTDLTFVFDGFTTDKATNLSIASNSEPDRKNVIIWNEVWPPANAHRQRLLDACPRLSSSASDEEIKSCWNQFMAYTTYSARTSGTMEDADIDLNGIDYFWSAPNEVYDNCPPADYDIQNILTHEIGHMLGLDDTPFVGEVMNGYGEKADVKYNLSQREVDCLCWLYPFGASSPTDRPPETGQGGCSHAPLYPIDLGMFWAMVPFILFGRRRNRSRTSPH